MPTSSVTRFYKIGEWMVIILLVLLPFHAFLKTWLSFILTDTTVDFLAPGSFLIASWKEIVIGLLGLWWLLRVIIERKWPFKFVQTDILLVLFALSQLLYAALSPDIQAVLWGLKTNVSFVALYILVRSIKCTFLSQELIMKIIVSTTFLVTVVGFLQIILPPEFWLNFGFTPYVSSYVDYKPLPIYHGISDNFSIIRIYSTLSGPNQLGNYLAVITLLLLPVMWFHYKLKHAKYGNAIALVVLLSIFMIVFTFSRAAWIGLVAGLTVLAWHAVSKKTKIICGIGGLLIVIAGLFFWQSAYPQSFETVIVHGSSTSERIVKWQEAAEIITLHPFGLGLGQAGPVSRRLYGEENAIISENWYLQLAEETGVIPALLFLASLILLFFELHAHYRKEPESLAGLISLGLAAGTVAFSVNGLFLHSFDDSTAVYIFFILVAIAMKKYAETLYTTSQLKNTAINYLFKK